MKRVVVLYGGRSSEHSISCVSAGSALKAIDRTLFEPLAIGITKQGEWIISKTDPTSYSLDSLPELTADENSRPVVIDFTAHGDGFFVGEPGTVGKPVSEQNLQPLGHVDAVFPVLHGLGGEDGAIQGMLETLGVPYVGCGIFASAAGIDKRFTKVILKAAGIPVAPGFALDARTLDAASHFEANKEYILARVEKEGLAFPLFVKPGDGGSSIGVSRVDNLEELLPALWLAAGYDHEIIIEKCITAREIECAVLSLDQTVAPQTAWPGEVVNESDTFYDFEQKYQSSSTSHAHVPADLPQETLQKVRDVASRAFTALNGRGLMRVDCFVEPDGTVMVNEVNTMPGFTAISMWPMEWEHMGLSYTDAITQLINSSL